MSELLLTSADLRQMYAYDLCVYAGPDGLYLDSAARWPEDLLVADAQEVADRLGYTDLADVAEEDEVLISA